MENRMVDLPKKKVGIVACSGEELPEGTITRLAALRVLENLRPEDTVTICLPLFLAGGEGDRAFARFYPTISIDGCELRCAQRATERYSNKPAMSLVVRDVIANENLEQPAGKRRLNQAGVRAVEITAQVIARSVDELLGKAWSREVGDVIEPQTPGEPPEISTQAPEVATCACGSGIPVQQIMIAGQAVTLVGLPLIFQQFVEAGKNPNEVNLGELMETIKIYNPIPKDEEGLYIDGVRKAYTDFWFKDRDK
jgi:uncharacterized metal-binding protein